MKLVILLFNNRQSSSAIAAVEMSWWCKGHGLVYNRDYDWAFVPDSKEIHFRFYNEAESYSTLFALTWAGYESN